MTRHYYNDDFFAAPYEYEYPYDNPYENFDEIPACPLINNERNFCPMMQRNIVFPNDYSFQSEYNPKINYAYNSNMNEGIFHEGKLQFQSMRGFQPENFGPTIMAMPMIIDFDEEEE